MEHEQFMDSLEELLGAAATGDADVGDEWERCHVERLPQDKGFLVTLADGQEHRIVVDP
jgi:hypothetical protein